MNAVTSRFRIAAVILAVLLAPRVARAATLTWDNGGADQLWTTTTNWNPDGTPTGNDIVFTNTGAAAAGTVTNDTDGSWTINTLNFLNTGSSGGAQTVRLAASQTLTISGTGATAFNVGPTGGAASNASPTFVVFNGGGALAVTGGTAATIAVATGSATGNMINSLNMSALGSFTANVGSFVVANNARQAATVLLSTVTNSITTTTFTVGSNSNASGSGNSCYIGLGVDNTLFANTINIGSIKSSGTMTFQGSVTNGAVTIRDYAGTGAATLVLGAQTASSGATSNGVLDFTAGRVDALFSTVTLGQGSPSTGTGGGLGTITLGPGVITSGTVNAGTAGATTSAVSTAVGTVNLLANSGTFAATSLLLGRQTNAQPSNSSGVVNQAGGLVSVGTLTFANYTAAGTGLVSGTYNLSGGTLRAATIQAGANSASTGTSSRTFNWTGGTIRNFDASTNLTIAGSNSLTLLLAGTGAKSLTADAGRTVTVSAVLGSTGTAGFSKDGPGTLVLSSTGGNWYSGTTTINAGVLNINSQWQLGGGNYQGLAFNGGTLQYASVLLNATTDPTTLGKPVTVDAGGGTIDTNGNAITVANAFGNGGSGAFTKAGAGTLAFNAAGTYTGATTVSAGTLLVNGPLASSGVTVGLAAVLGGTGTIANGVNVNGILSPGASAGLITMGSLTLNASGTTLIEVTSAGTRGIDYDAIDITTAGGLTYGGTLSLAFGAGALPDSTVLNVFGFTGSPSSSFAGVTASGYYAGTWTSVGGGDWQITSGAQTATFSQSAGTITIVPEPTTTLVAALTSGGMALLLLRRRRSTVE